MNHFGMSRTCLEHQICKSDIQDRKAGMSENAEDRRTQLDKKNRENPDIQQDSNWKPHS